MKLRFRPLNAIRKSRPIWLILGLIALLIPLLAGSVSAESAAQQTGSWIARYWNNTTLAGDPVLTRTEGEISHRWGTGSPAAGVDANRFSARWTRTINVPAGRYRFELTVDDGARLWVDGRLFIDAWQVQAEETYSGEIYLNGGDVPLQLEYFENTGLATVILDWEPLDQFVERWQGEYYDNTSLTGTPVLVRDDPAVDFDWGASSPAPDRVPVDNFSARWTRTVELTPGQYRFDVVSDDGVRVWIDRLLLIDEWQPQAATRFQQETSISGGPTDIRVEYFELGGLAEVELNWTRLHDRPAPDPGRTTVDNDDPGFIRGGPAADWTAETEGFGGSLLWSRTSAEADPPYNWGRWYPDLEPGIYEVAAYIPERFSTTSQARYWISHADDYTLRTVDQAVNSGRWVTLGTFRFTGSGSDFVSLADVTFEPEGRTRLVAYDALRWTPVGAASNAEAAVSPTSGFSGAEVVVTGSGFPPGEPVFLRLGRPASEPFGEYAQATSRADGSVVFELTMPFTTPAGTPLGNETLVFLLITPDGTKATADFQLR